MKILHLPLRGFFPVACGRLWGTLTWSDRVVTGGCHQTLQPSLPLPLESQKPLLTTHQASRKSVQTKGSLDCVLQSVLQAPSSVCPPKRDVPYLSLLLSLSPLQTQQSLVRNVASSVILCALQIGRWKHFSHCLWVYPLPPKGRSVLRHTSHGQQHPQGPLHFSFGLESHVVCIARIPEQ